MTVQEMNITLHNDVIESIDTDKDSSTRSIMFDLLCVAYNENVIAFKLQN